MVDTSGDISGSNSRCWTAAEIQARFAGQQLLARDANAQAASLPAGLAVPGNEVVPGWSQQLSSMHPEDRPLAVGIWWQSHAAPGKVFSMEVRYRLESGWERGRLSYLNLLHQPQWNVMLVALQSLGPAGELARLGKEPEVIAPGSASWHAAAWIVQYLDGLGTVLRTEGRVTEIFGVFPEQLANTNIINRLHPDDLEAALAMWLDVLAHPGEARTIRQRILRPDQTFVWIESTVTNRLEEPPPAGGAIVSVSHDISAWLSAEAALRASQRAFRSLAEEVPAAVFRADRDGRLSYANGNWYLLVSTLADPVTRLVDLAAEADRAAVAQVMESALTGGAGAHVSVEFTPARGDRRWRLNCRGTGDDAAEPGVLGVLEDITDAVALRHRASHDHLTGLLNREGLDRRLADLLTKSGVAVAFVDLDGFKQVNDRLGHDAGDELLAEIGRRLGALGAVVSGRWGGDEFVVIRPIIGSDPEVAAEIAVDLRHSLQRVLAEPVGLVDGDWPVTASIGLAWAARGASASDLLRRADQAMYLEKRARDPR